ncbi:hypothetical protein F4780DRAFT_791633 [Xylariomycetidae sp. FL0641]|nr:hypothetical protein F4780DRAFT_791633 [Xylariomycetidae sp. FL0641]
MGGLAFSSGDDPLNTPRMKPELYQLIRDQAQAKLRELFWLVATPIEGPGKKNYGDIDIFLAWPKVESVPGITADPPESDPKAWLAAAVQRLGAARVKEQQQATHVTLAIELPQDLAHLLSSEQDGTDRQKFFVQIDLQFCPDQHNFEWMLFKHAHGDLWNLLGSTIRPFGLTIDEEALWLRIPEIEAANRRRAKVRLTGDPGEVLAFLGLRNDAHQWQRPFATPQDLFRYAASCRLFWVRPEEEAEEPEGGPGNDGTTQKKKKKTTMDDGLERKARDAAENNNTSNNTSTTLPVRPGEHGTSTTTTVGGSITTRALKSNDRRRMAYRPVFAAWVGEFLPACRAAGTHAAAPGTRASVFREAATAFAGVGTEYDARLRAWRRERQRDALWRDVIKAALPPPGEALEPNLRGVAAAALKKVVLQGSREFGVWPDAAALLPEGADGLLDEAYVRRWTQANWPAVAAVAWKRNHERFTESRAAKRTAAGQVRNPAASGASQRNAEAQAGRPA